jgi:DNA-binding MarR family transcriptional regulator
MIKFLKFDQVPLPVYKEVKGKEYIYYGERNDYPNYLLRIYNNSAKHNAIVTGKVDYICGNGWGVKSEDEMEKAKVFGMIDKVNTKEESLNELTNKLVTDLTIFGGYYLQIIWTKATGEIAEMYHVDYYKVRTNADNSEFYVSDNWIKNDNVNPRPDFETYPAFDPNNTTGSQILYFKEYRAGVNTYSLPDYRGAISYIELDISIGEYHLNTINNGMFSSKLINLNGGKVSQEEEDRIEKQFQNKFSGSKNAGKFMLAFNDSKENEPSIIDLSGTELDKHFDLLNLTVQQEIFSGHKITSPMLFGIKTEGQLGGRSELRDAYQLFQNTYVNAKQRAIEETINYLYKFNDVTAKLELKPTEPISFEFSEAIIVANMTQDEIREKLSLPAIEKVESDSSKEIINALNSLNPTILAKVMENLSKDEIRSLIGFKVASEVTTPLQELDVVEGLDLALSDHMHLTCSHTKKDDEILALFEGKGCSRDRFKVIQNDRMVFSSSMDEFVKQELFAEYQLNEVQRKILSQIQADPKVTIPQIAKATGIDEASVIGRINTLIDDNVLTEDISRVGLVTRKVTRTGEAAIKRLQPVTSFRVLYSYEERENVPPAASGSRPLCDRLFNAEGPGKSLLFTREEIQNISNQLGYSVFQLCGGWYTNPETKRRTPFCRHEWRRNVVVEKTTR